MLEVEKAIHSSSTPSSEDVGAAVDADPQLNISVDSGEYEVPQLKPKQQRIKTTVSGVTADAARVWERLLQKTDALRTAAASVHDSSDVEGEHQYAVVADQYVPPDQMPTPYQPMGSEESLCCKPGALMTTSAFDKFGAPLESDYVDCEMFLAGQGKLSSTRSFHTLGLLTRSPGAKDLVQHPPKVKSKPKRLTALDSSSSSSTEDYEYTDNELLYRKKKSFFRWASERIESIRSKGKKSTVATSVKRDRPDFSAKSAVPLPPPPTAAGSVCGGLQRNGSEKSKSNSSSTPNETADAPLHRGAELETLAEEQLLHKKSGLTLKKSDPGKDKKKDSSFATEEKIKDSRGVFDGLLRQFRRGSAKLKGKGSRAKHRSRSADTCAIRRPTQEAMKLVERLVDVSTREPPSEYESDVPAVRLSVATSQLQYFDPITPPLPAKLSTLRTTIGTRQALRAKMNLDGLIACRPQMPTPNCGPFVPPLVDATDGNRGLPDLEQSLALKSSKPFADKSQCEKEELYERIAEQLAAIADKLNLESPRSMKSSSQSGPEDEKTELSGGIATATEDHLQLDMLVPRQTGDLASFVQPIEAVAAPIVAELVQNARNSNVSRFQQLVSDNVGSDTGWQAIARMFRLTQSAVQMAGMGTAVARQIKEMTLNYFEDRFASWIVDQGGWESMVEETNTELDSELD